MPQRGERVSEQWKAIPGYEGYYEVSDRGRVKSVKRKTINGRTAPEMIRRPNVMKGYHCIALKKDCTVKVFRIHRLVLEAFGCSQPGEEYQVNHIDGDKSNNALENLEWVPAAENTRHAFETGLRPKHLSEETRAKIGEKSRETWKDPIYQEMQSEMQKRAWGNNKPERSAAIKEGIRRAKDGRKRKRA